jgi:DNA repair protein RadD
MNESATLGSSRAARDFETAVFTSSLRISPQLAPPQAPAANRPATAPTNLRPHQTNLIDEIDHALAAGCRRIVVQAPTGFGKTMVAATLARRATAAGRRSIFTVPALSLIDQTVEKFFAEGIQDLGVIQADHFLTNYARSVQVASVQTLSRREVPRADLAIIDEVHRWFDVYAQWLRGPWKDVPVIGLSATPWTRGLGRYFDKLIIGSTTAKLIETGYLSKFRVFAPASPDLTGVRTVAGDFREDDLAKAMDKASLVADVVETWQDRGQDRPTLCFAVDRAHAKHLQQKFIEADVSAGYIDAYTDAAERREIARQFHAGEIKVICNVGCLTTGIDWDVRAIILARPTKSEMLFVQMIGRGLRTADGKADCLILDHSDNHIRLGFVTDIQHDHLDDGRQRQKPVTKERQALPKKCPRCAFLRPAKILACPACGFMPVPQTSVATTNGELVEMRSRSTAMPVDTTMFYRELKHYASERGYKAGWVAHKFRERFGCWPNGLEHLPPLEPSRATQNWIRSKQIAWARSQPGRAM